MRVLVVGTVPPPGGEAAKRLGAVAAELTAAGDVVEILSPDRRSAAHSHARLAGPRLAIELAVRARHFDAVVINAEPGLPLAPTADRLTRAVTLGALGAVLRGYGDVTVRLPTPIPLPGGVGGRATRALWSRATTIVVATEDDRERMVLAPGVVADRVVVEKPPARVPATAEADWSRLPTEGDLRSSVQTIVRERAARDRNVNRARSSLGSAGLPEDSGDPFQGDAGIGTPLSPVELARFATGRARRGVLKVARIVRSARA
jgi:hypothetical protein